MRSFVALILICLAGFTGTALAADAVAASDPSFSEITKAIFDAVMKGSWWAAAAYGVVLTMIGLRKFMPASWKEGVRGDVVGTAAAFVMAFAGAVATVMLTPGATMTAAVVLTALKIGVAAIGGYTVIHKLLGWLGSMALPSWALAILKLLGAVIGSNAIKKAEAAGDKAVAANPPTGTAGNHKIIEIE